MAAQNQAIIAYEIHPQNDMPIEPAPIEREWMEAADRFAYRCLPLTIANQSGWIIRNAVTVTACWNGGPDMSDLKVTYGDAATEPAVDTLGLTTIPELGVGTESRRDFISGLQQRRKDVLDRRWQKHYFKGEAADGTRFESHQTRLAVKSFVHDDR